MNKTDPKDKRKGRSSFGKTVLSVLLVGAAISGLVAIGAPQLQANSPASPPAQPLELSNPVSRGIQKILGINRLAAWIGSRQLKKEIRKKVQGRVNVKLKPYSGFDLKEGKARALSIKGHDLLYDNAFYVSEFTLQTDEDTPIWIDLDSGDLRSPLEADVTIRIDEADMNKSVATPALRSEMENIKVPLLGMGEQRVRLLNPKVTFKPERIRLKTKMGVQGLSDDKALPLDIETGLEPTTSRALIGLKDVDIAPISGISNMSVLEGFLEEGFQWLLKPSKLLPLDGGRMEVRSVRIADDDITLKGHIWLVPPRMSPR